MQSNDEQMTENSNNALLAGETSTKTAISKSGIKVSQNVLGDRSLFSLTEKEIIQHIRLGYRVMVIMRGAPGSGKSSLARSILQESYSNLDSLSPQDFIMSADDYFYDNTGRYDYKVEKISEAHAFIQKKVTEKAAVGWSPIFVDNTNIRMWEMWPYVKIALQNGYFVKTLEPRTPWKNSPTELASKNSHGIPRKKIQRMLSKYENATIADMIKALRGANSSEPVLKMKIAPILETKGSENMSSETFQQKKARYSNGNDDTCSKDNIVKKDEAPKAQRKHFSSENMSSETFQQKKARYSNGNDGICSKDNIIEID